MCLVGHLSSLHHSLCCMAAAPWHRKPVAGLHSIIEGWLGKLNLRSLSFRHSDLQPCWCGHTTSYLWRLKKWSLFRILDNWVTEVSLFPVFGLPSHTWLTFFLLREKDEPKKGKLDTFWAFTFLASCCSYFSQYFFTLCCLLLVSLASFYLTSLKNKQTNNIQQQTEKGD